MEFRTTTEETEGWVEFRVAAEVTGCWVGIRVEAGLTEGWVEFRVAAGAVDGTLFPLRDAAVAEHEVEVTVPVAVEDSLPAFHFPFFAFGGNCSTSF